MKVMLVAFAAVVVIVALWTAFILFLGLISGYSVDKKQHEMEGRTGGKCL
jgi:hypothetical protein